MKNLKTVENFDSFLTLSILILNYWHPTKFKIY